MCISSNKWQAHIDATATQTYKKDMARAWMVMVQRGGVGAVVAWRESAGYDGGDGRTVRDGGVLRDGVPGCDEQQRGCG